MYSSLFCGNLETSAIDANLIEKDHQDIKLYKIELLKYQGSVSKLIKYLSASEHHRANRYHFEKDKNRFVICRSLLKVLLADHIGLATDKIILDTDSNKKPFLVSHPSVYFNVSHAGDYALIAIAKRPIGVDIEYVNKSFEYNEILPNIFNKTEIEEVEHSIDKHLTFYQFWTRKEAIVKAIGKGIDDDLVKIPATDGLHSVPSAVLCDYKKINVFSFNITGDYVGTVAFTEDINIDKIAFYTIPTISDD